MRKKVLIVMALVLAVAVPASVSFAKKEVAKPKTITAFLDTTFLMPEDGQAQFCEEYKKQTGIELKVIQPSHNEYYEKLRLAFAAGEFPDVVEISGNDYSQYAMEGAFVDLEPYIKKSSVCKKISKENFEGMRVQGKIFAFPTQVGTGVITYVRKDWLENLKLKEPKTWDDFVKVLKAFTLNDPDQNGKQDTYGMTSSVGSEGNISFANNYYRDIYLDANPDFEYRNGKWIDGFAQPEMKPAMERFYQVYREKLIDPEIFTNKTSTCREKFYSGKCGVFPYWYGTWNVTIEVETQKNLGPKAKVVPIAALKGGYNQARVPTTNAITIKSKNPEAVFKYFLEYLHDGAQGQFLFVHGVENVHWVKKDGVYTKLPAMSNPKKLFAKTYIPPEAVLTPWKDPFPIDERITNSKNLFLKNFRQALLQPMPESRIKIDDQINVLKSKYIGKILLGEMTAEQALAQYKKDATALGIDTVLADMNK